MNGSARPTYKHYLLYLPPFDVTDRLETRQQALVLLLSNCGCPFQRECCLLVLNSVTSTPQWIRQPEAAWGYT
jgi:hypothetical protein